jgi:two-component sensor histidine kinase/CHASE3 domain sensor protein
VTISAIGVVALAIIMAAWINREARVVADAVSHAIEIRERAERFLGRLRDAETGQRGYLLTGKAAYLQPFSEGSAEAGPELEVLAALVDADPEQKARIERLRAAMRTKLAELAQTITLERSGRRDEAIGIVRDGPGIAAMSQIRDAVLDIQRTENARLLSLYRSEERRRLWGSTGIVVALAGLAFAAWQQLRARQRRSAALALSNAELEQIVSDRTRQLESERLRIEALLRDVNHRVGNNLAMVSALLNVQSRQSAEPAVKTALMQAQARIQAIAAGQRRLRLDIDTDEVEARPYMEDLLAEIGKSAEGRPIAIDLEMDAIRLPGRDAVSFVVIVNELVTNAIKHAFPDGAPGRIAVSLEPAELEGEPGLCMRIEDDGVGISQDNRGKGLGQTVIASLLRSMHATMTIEPLRPGQPRPGTCVKVMFPKRKT